MEATGGWIRGGPPRPPTPFLCHFLFNIPGAVQRWRLFIYPRQRVLWPLVWYLWQWNSVSCSWVLEGGGSGGGARVQEGDGLCDSSHASPPWRTDFTADSHVFTPRTLVKHGGWIRRIAAVVCHVMWMWQLLRNHWEESERDREGEREIQCWLDVWSSSSSSSTSTSTTTFSPSSRPPSTTLTVSKLAKSQSPTAATLPVYNPAAHSHVHTQRCGLHIQFISRTPFCFCLLLFLFFSFLFLSPSISLSAHYCITSPFFTFVPSSLSPHQPLHVSPLHPGFPLISFLISLSSATSDCWGTGSDRETERQTGRDK